MNEKKKKINKKTLIIIGVSFLLIAFSVVIMFIFFIPNVKLLGDRIVTIRLNDEYNEPGVLASYILTDVSDDVEITGDIDNTKVGEYIVNYKINKGLFTINKQRKVKVIDDIKPVITLQGDTNVVICPAKKFDEIGFEASDNYDGDLTEQVKIVETEEKITYSVSDSSGNSAITERIFDRTDIEKPKIVLNGQHTIYVNNGNKYTDPGFTASDNCDGDLTDNVIVEGNVDTSTPGTKTIKYRVVDTAGNETIVERSVYVKSPEATTPRGVYKKSMIYLTFDDGPSNSTPQILDILKEKGVTATFFVINNDNSLNYLIKREYDEGHTVALHSATHKYDVVYQSVDAYFNDLNIISNKVKNIIGIDSKIIRFPGGSSNTISRYYSIGIMKTLTNEVLAKGYHYFDWNIDCNDAAGVRNPQVIYNNVINNLSHDKTNVVLMHDFANNTGTINALRDIIDYGKKNGYTFASIDMDTPMVIHGVNN